MGIDSARAGACACAWSLPCVSGSITACLNMSGTFSVAGMPLRVGRVRWPLGTSEHMGHVGAGQSLSGECLSSACPRVPGASLLEGMARCVLQVPWPGDRRHDNVYSFQEELAIPPGPSPSALVNEKGWVPALVRPSALCGLPPSVHGFRVLSFPR